MIFKSPLDMMLLIVLTLSIFSSISHAYEIPVNFTTTTLNASISPTNLSSFNESPVELTFNLNVYNRNQTEMRLYFAERFDDTWKVISDLGNVSPKSSMNTSFRIRFEYNGVTTYSKEYAIISDTMAAKRFTLNESWGPYEGKTKDILSIMGFIVVPIISIVLIFVLYLFRQGSIKRQETARSRGKDIPTLSECVNLSERIVWVLSNPAMWILSFMLAFALMGYLVFTGHPELDLSAIMQLSLISAVAAFFIPLLLMVLVWYADIQEREPLKYVVAMFTWGVFAALIAFFVNPILIAAFNISLSNVPLVLIVVFGSVIISPISEEILKALGVYAMAGHREMDNTLDGLLYGFAIGVGFAAVENWFYFISKMDPFAIGIDAWILAVVYRSFFNTIAHGCFTAFVGAMMGMIKARPRMAGYSYLGFIPGLFIAIILHMIFNLSAFLDIVSVKTFKAAILFFNPLLVVTIGVGFIIIYYFGIRESMHVPLS